MLSLWRKTDTRSVLNVILTSDRAELCISLADPQGKTRILFETGKPIDIGSGGDKPLLMRLTDALSSACDEVVREGLVHIVSKKIARGHFDSIEVFYGAPWYVSRGRHVLVERSDTGPISEKALRELVTKSIEGLLPKEMRGAVILEEHLHGFTINGYPVENPIGMEGREVGVRIFVSAIDTATKDAVETVLHHSFHARQINHHSTLLPLIQAFRRTNATEAAYLLVEVSGYMTEVSKVDRGMVLDTVSFPEGTETMIANVANSLKRRPEEIQTIAKRPNDFGLTEEFKVAHDDALTNWSRGYMAALQTLGAGGLSSGVTLIAESPARDSFKREITRIGAGSVFAPTKESYASLYDPSARPNAHVLSALLATV